VAIGRLGLFLLFKDMNEKDKPVQRRIISDMVQPGRHSGVRHCLPNYENALYGVQPIGRQKYDQTPRAASPPRITSQGDSIYSEALLSGNLAAEKTTSVDRNPIKHKETYKSSLRDVGGVSVATTDVLIVQKRTKKPTDSPEDRIVPQLIHSKPSTTVTPNISRDTFVVPSLKKQYEGALGLGYSERLAHVSSSGVFSRAVTNQEATTAEKASENVLDKKSTNEIPEHAQEPKLQYEGSYMTTQPGQQDAPNRELGKKKIHTSLPSQTIKRDMVTDLPWWNTASIVLLAALTAACAALFWEKSVIGQQALVVGCIMAIILRVRSDFVFICALASLLMTIVFRAIGVEYYVEYISVYVFLLLLSGTILAGLEQGVVSRS